jgi:2-C-methyl-D-erythritol 4-phosphate cytidylyltransferase/2-C-methyl-D-erythritol 2,4-cyclodiphosphate synthase
MNDREHSPLHLIILAGGLGSRARHKDSAAPKQFRTIAGTMLFMWSVRELLQAEGIVSLAVAVPEPWQAVAQKELETAPLGQPWLLAPAGETRTASTWNAAAALAAQQAPAADDLVAVHDAARPFASRHLLNRLAAAAARSGAAVPGFAVPDTIVRIAEHETGEPAHVSAHYLDRAELLAVQTPQVFRWEPFHAAHHWSHTENQSFTDDGGLLAIRGLRPVVVMGEADNWKITTEGDWTRAEAALYAR